MIHTMTVEQLEKTVVYTLQDKKVLTQIGSFICGAWSISSHSEEIINLLTKESLH